MDRLVIIGVGNRLRRDDAVGLVVVERLAEVHPEIDALVIEQIDVTLAETLAGYERLVIVDAACLEEAPYRFVPLEPAAGLASRQVTHLYDWPQILAVAACLYGHAPETQVLEIAASDFSLGEGLSAGCRRNAGLAIEALGQGVTAAPL